MKWLRGLFVGDWRNKGVALFFAILVWSAAYQSEKRELRLPAKVILEPSDSRFILTRVIVPRAGAEAGGPDFGGNIMVSISGPRKAVDRLQADGLPSARIRVPHDKKTFTFQGGDFNFPRDGVVVTEFDPPSVMVQEEPLVTLSVKNLADKITVTNLPEGFEVATREVVPAGQEVSISGPESLLARLGVSLPVAVGYLRESFEGKVDVNLSLSEEIPAELVRRTITYYPKDVHVRIVLRATSDVLSADSVKITFRIPPTKVPVRIVLDEVVGDTIPVEFYGRKDEIARLRERLREEPGFSLGVRVPSFDREKEAQFTFTEDALELYGFPGVQIRQHESRRKDKKTAWSYSVVPLKEGGP